MTRSNMISSTVMMTAYRMGTYKEISGGSHTDQNIAIMKK